MELPVKKMSPDARLPVYSSEKAAGADLFNLGERVIVPAGKTVFIHTGICIAVPDGCVGLVYARSGLASKRGLAPANKVGVIDSDYRGEVMVALHNHSDEDQTVEPYDRVAQLVIAPVYRCLVTETDELDDTTRGAGGFGSTGR